MSTDRRALGGVNRCVTGHWHHHRHWRSGVGAGESTSRAEIRVALEDIQLLLQQAQAGGAIQDLLTVLGEAKQSAPEIRRTIVVWVDLVEVLVQDAERRYGSGSKLGSIKKADVQAVVYYLVKSSRFDVPFVPRRIRPLVVDVATGWITDVVVDVANHYGLWVLPEDQPRRTFRGAVRALLGRLGALLRRVGALLLVVATPFVWLAVHVAGWLRERPPLSPRLRAAVAAIEQEAMISRPSEHLSVVDSLVGWLVSHPRQTVACIRLVFAAVDQVESFTAMSGPEKKAYATDLVMIALEDLGLPRDGFFNVVIEAIVDGTIEAAVAMFNKRGAFTHTGSASAPAATPSVVGYS